MQVDWAGLGCKKAARVKGQNAKSTGRAAWRLRAPRRSRTDWVIEADHCPYLGQHPYRYGDDAWRISIQLLDRGDNPVEVAHLVATSEAEAFEAVTWLDVAARLDDGRPPHFAAEVRE